MSAPNLRDALANESDAVRKEAEHMIRHGDEDAFHVSAPSRRDIALALLQKANDLDHQELSRAERDRLEAIQMTLGWVMGWGDLELPDPEPDTERGDH